jgi:hypothetical protein
METTNLKLGFSSYMGLIIILLVFGCILMKDSVFELVLNFTGGDQIAESQQANQEVTALLLSVDKITFDTSILNSGYLQSLTPFPDFPVDTVTLSNFGKANPFIGNFIVVPDTATSSVGSVIYSSQRSVNNGQSLRAVNPNRR